MRSKFWSCEIQKNWSGELREDMLARNVVCYGKPGSGKTEKVVKPFLRHAIEAGNSILLLTRKGDAVYADIFDLAYEKDYDIWDQEPMYRRKGYSVKELNREAVSMLFEMLKKPTIYCVYMENAGRWEYSSIQAFLNSVAAAQRRDMFTEEDCRLSLVIDDADWDVSLPREVRQSRWMNFCVSMDNLRLTKGDFLPKRFVEIRESLDVDREARSDGSYEALLKDMSAAIATGDHGAVVATLDRRVDTSALRNNINPVLSSANDALVVEQMQEMPDGVIRSYAAMATPLSIKDFFQDVQTVVCTGIAGVSPEEHRDFQLACIVRTGMRAPGGKYLVTELCAPLQAMPKSVFPKTVMTWAKNTPIEERFTEYFAPGHCVVEQNGAVKIFASHAGELIPVVFATVSQALSWLDMYFTQQGWGVPEAVEIDPCNLRYLLPTVNDRGEQDEIVISYIHEEDVDAYVEQALMIAMEVEEYLTHPELMAEVPGLALKKEAANISLQKIASFACRNYRRVRKVASVELPVDKETKEQVASMFEEYKWRPYQKPVEEKIEQDPEPAADILPHNRVLFLGGHTNMIKKLRQIFPDWDFLTDDELGSWTGGECDFIFFWANHSSHKIWQYVQVRKEKDTPILYVTATNINRLVSEMVAKYTNHLAKQPATV